MGPVRLLLPILTLGSAVNLVDHVAGGKTVSLPDNDPTCAQTSQAVSADVCRVAMTVTTSDASQITLEAWFPRDYSGRFVGVGNGGLGGCIQYYDLAYTSSLGFAAVEDFVYRSVHTGIVVGKQLTKLFYDEGFDKSYYLDELDGIVSGAPAFNFIGLQSWSAHFYPIIGPVGSGTYLSVDDWSLVHDEVLRQCDGLDGAMDGIIEDPDVCHPNMVPILCMPWSDEDKCLTTAQVNTVHQVFSPLLSANGSIIYPRMQPGSKNWASQFMYNGQPFPLSTDWWRYVIYNDPTWDASTWTVKDAEAAIKQNPYNIATWNADLAPLRDAGTKLLTYHGL
ncbi:hypothetical protein N7449_000698 [Penicillium cf. viridicatum]|uniref:Carboxylic ester hydrolase n=1 Tax=Penicillium cf. viridicatum TaxID=2972119 RepID=A0A9W9T8T1_9EURO|nr:hypothetical protein N7449_000698 [Penicillium cf. viridicatum]